MVTEGTSLQHVGYLSLQIVHEFTNMHVSYLLLQIVVLQAINMLDTCYICIVHEFTNMLDTCGYMLDTCGY